MLINESSEKEDISMFHYREFHIQMIWTTKFQNNNLKRSNDKDKWSPIKNMTHFLLFCTVVYYGVSYEVISHGAIL